MAALFSTTRGRQCAERGPRSGLPEIEYPSPLASLPDGPLPFTVKNTFIDSVSCQPSSLLGSSAFAPRAVRSCPGSRTDEGSCDLLASECEEQLGTARSRSTSAGASTRASEAEASEFDYPATEFSVRNTFVDMRTGKLSSMVDDAFEERKIRSCPTSRLVDPDADVIARLAAAAAQLEEAEYDEDEDDFVPSPAAYCSDDEEEFVPMPSHATAGVVEGRAPDFVPLPPAAPAPTWEALSFPAPPPSAPAPSWEALSLPAPPPPPPAPVAPPADAASPAMVATSRLGSPECPTEGSQFHWQGTCKPCAHAFTKGCANGVGCQFCHLCEPGELKRRQKAKRSSQRALQSVMRSSGAARS